MWSDCKMPSERFELQLADALCALSNVAKVSRTAICNFHFAFFFLAASGQLTRAADAPAAAVPKPAAVQRLLDRTPFDRVVLNAANGGTTLDVLTLTLPQRPLDAMPTTGSLKVRLLNRPTEEFEVDWANIAQVRIFEQVLLDEAERLTRAGKFDDAYDYYLHLEKDFPALPTLKTSVCDYLRLNAVALSQSNENDRALALLMTLYQREPTYAALPEAVEKVAGAIIQSYLKQGDFAAARQVLELWQTQFQNVAAQAAANWQIRFQSAAGRQVAEANSLIGQKQYIPARKAVGRALAIWPSLPASKETLARIDREFPYVTVGVLETSPNVPMRRIDDWASLRTSRLTQRLLAEEFDFGADGGAYRSPFGEWSVDESGRELTLKCAAAAAAGNNPMAAADAIARFILASATPGSASFRSDVASLVDGVSIVASNSVRLHLKRVHVRPESVFQLPMPAGGNVVDPSVGAGAFAVADFTPQQVVFAAKTTVSGVGGPQAIVEQTLPNDEAAIAALMNGDVDVLDRVPPWHLARLRTMKDIRIGIYKLPTVHVLIPNLKQPLLAKREFRRALCYGIDRKWIVGRALLGGVSLPGFEPISGPFPSGTSLSDPIRYGYNNQIQPRSFEPRLAAILATVAWASVQNPPEKDKPAGDKSATAKKSAEPVDTALPELVLAYPHDAVAKVACQSIKAQLVREGIPIKLREFTADELIAGKVECDLRYAELTVNEPLADAARLFGPQGIVSETDSAVLATALRNLDVAANWKDVRGRLAEIHEIVNHELPVLPLWQTVNYFAYRTSVRGITESPVTLYQDVEQWQATPGENVASVGAAPK